MRLVHEERWGGTDGQAWNANWSAPTYTSGTANDAVDINSGVGRIKSPGTGSIYGSSAISLLRMPKLYNAEVKLRQAAPDGLAGTSYINIRSSADWTNCLGGTYGVSFTYDTGTAHAAASLGYSKAGTFTAIPTALTSTPAGVTTADIWVRLRAQGNRAMAKMWLATNPEPVGWLLECDLGVPEADHAGYLTLARQDGGAATPTTVLCKELYLYDLGTQIMAHTPGRRRR